MPARRLFARPHCDQVRHHGLVVRGRRNDGSTVHPNYILAACWMPEVLCISRRIW
jgi:hypothetical protein